MTPHLTNSPIRGKTKLDMLPMLIPLKVVVRVMLSSIGRRSLLQRRARSQKANAPAAMDRRMNSHLQFFIPLIKSAHSTSLNDAHSRRAARASETIYLILFLTFIISSCPQPSKLWFIRLNSRDKVTQKFKMFSTFARLYNKL